MAGFRAASGGVTVRLGPAEAVMLRNLVSQIAGLVGATPADSLADSPADSAPAAGSPASGGLDGIPNADELEAMVGLSPSVTAPDDPVLARLLPDGYRDDPEAAQDFRRFTEASLRSAKAAAAQAVLDSLPPDGGKLRLTGEQADSWLRALNDVRLALGVMLNVTDDFSYQPSAGADEQQRFAVGVYDWLTFLQDSLVAALS